MNTLRLQLRDLATHLTVILAVIGATGGLALLGIDEAFGSQSLDQDNPRHAQTCKECSQRAFRHAQTVDRPRKVRDQSPT